jgi:hypothetical protein
MMMMIESQPEIVQRDLVRKRKATAFQRGGDDCNLLRADERTCVYLFSQEFCLSCTTTFKKGFSSNLDLYSMESKGYQSNQDVKGGSSTVRGSNHQVGV